MAAHPHTHTHGRALFSSALLWMGVLWRTGWGSTLNYREWTFIHDFWVTFTPLHQSETTPHFSLSGQWLKVDIDTVAPLFQPALRRWMCLSNSYRRHHPRPSRMKMAAYGPDTHSNGALTASSGQVNAVLLPVESEQLCQNPGASGIWARLCSPSVSRRTLWMGGSVCFITGDWEELRVCVCVCVAHACLCISMPVCLLQLCFSAAGFFFFFLIERGTGTTWLCWKRHSN